MNAVIEINKIGQTVNFDPLDGFIGAIALANGFEVGGSTEKNRMAIHAGLCRRDSGNGGSFDAGMTITAVNAVIADVMLMAELHRLLSGNILPRHIGRARHGEHSHERHSDQKKRRKHTESRDEIRTAMKNLGHVFSALYGGTLRKGAVVRASHELTGQCKTRAVLDAIVSNKTFWIATSASGCSQTLSGNFLYRTCGTFKSFKQFLRLLVSTGMMNEVKANRSLSVRTSLLLMHQSTVRSLMQERIEKFKHFFTNIFDEGICQGQGRGILEIPSAALIASEPTLFRVAPASRGSAARRWGVVQLVGHLTVNEDGEGSNPSAPAKFPL